MQKRIIPILLLIALLLCSCQKAPAEKQTEPITIVTTLPETTEPTETTEPMSTEEMYALAQEYFQNEHYQAAKPLFEELGDYESSQDYLWAVNFAIDHFGFYVYYKGTNKYIFEIGKNVTVMDISNNFSKTVYGNTFVDHQKGECRMIADGGMGTYAFVDRDGSVEFFSYGRTPTSSSTADKYETLYRQPDDFSFPTEPKIGMTAEEVRNSTWGEPKKINTTVTAYHTTEQWCYSDYRYVYLEDGIVTSIQK